MKQFRLIALVLAFALLPLPALAAKSPGFSDVDADLWYASYVDYVAQEGIMIGTGEGRFFPEKPLTQAECLTLAYRIYDVTRDGDGSVLSAPEDWTLPSDFLDGWWRDTAYTIQSRGLGDIFPLSEFRPTDATRLFFARYVGRAANGLEAINEIDFLPDVAPDSPWWAAPLSAGDRDQVYALYGAGVLTGVDEYGALAGSRTLTRAEAAAMAARVLDPSLRVHFTPSLPTEGYTLTQVPGIDYDTWTFHDYDAGLLHASWFTLGTVWNCGIFWADGTVYVPPSRIAPPEYSGETLILLDGADGHAVLNARTRDLIFPWTKDVTCSLFTIDGEEFFTVQAGDDDPLLYNAAGEQAELPEGLDWSHAYTYGNGLYPDYDEISGLYGYRDLAWNWALTPQWSEAYSFSEARAVVATEDGYGAIDLQGQELLPCQYPFLTGLGDGLYLVSPTIGYEMGGTVADLTGQERVTPYIHEGVRFQNGYAPLTLRSQYGLAQAGVYYISTDLVPVSQRFDYAGPIGEDGAGFVVLDGKVYRIQFE